MGKTDRRMCNLYLAMMDKITLHLDQFGDSKRRWRSCRDRRRDGSKCPGRNVIRSAKEADTMTGLLASSLDAYSRFALPLILARSSQIGSCSGRSNSGRMARLAIEFNVPCPSPAAEIGLWVSAPPRGTVSRVPYPSRPLHGLQNPAQSGATRGRAGPSGSLFGGPLRRRKLVSE